MTDAGGRRLIFGKGTKLRIENSEYLKNVTKFYSHAHKTQLLLLRNNKTAQFNGFSDFVLLAQSIISVGAQCDTDTKKMTFSFKMLHL